MNGMIELTPEEEKAIKALKRVANNWPDTLWLFSANGTLNVMKCNQDGERAYKSRRCGDGSDENVDQEYCMDEIDIPNDGGDW